MAGPAYHVISREIYKQPIMTKLWNYNIFVEVSYSCLTGTMIGF